MFAAGVFCVRLVGLLNCLFSLVKLEPWCASLLLCFASLRVYTSFELRYEPRQCNKESDARSLRGGGVN
jgi:hypothetical protein